MPSVKTKKSKPRAPHGLSKSKFCLGVQCLKALHLKIHNPELLPPVDPETQMIFDQGKEVGIEARKHYPGGVLIDHDHLHSREALEATQKAIQQKVPAIFEAAFHFHNTLVRVDILKRNRDGSWDLIEVKSSTKLKEEHLPDLAIQRYVVEGCGLKIKRTLLKHLNSECVFPDLKNLFTDTDCTDDVETEFPLIEAHIEEMLAILKKKSPPKVEIGPHCNSPYACPFQEECWKHVPEHSVFELHGVYTQVKFDLYERGIIRIKDIPVDEKVSRAKPQQLQAVLTQKPVIDRAGLREFIKALQYPLYFFDFETLNPAIPKYKGLSPYSQIPFQFSCHIVEKEGSKLKHVEYLADGTKDPRKEVAEKMLAALGTEGTILAFNHSFEKARISELAEQLPSLRSKLLKLLPRFVDLKDAFTDSYYHPDFHGSFSLKDVLTVLVPSMSYEGMAVADGGGAQVAYLKLCDPNTSKRDRIIVRRNLIEYCKQDTYAMVVLLEALKNLANRK